MRKIGLVVLLSLAAVPAFAKSVEVQPSCNSSCQPAFASMSEDLVATIDYKALGPAEATGVAGFGLGVVASYVPVDSGDWNTVTGTDLSGLGLVGLQVTKGLPLNIDVGAFFTAVPDTDVKVYGAEIRFAVLEGSTVSPAIAIRGSYVTVDGIDSFDLESKTVDVSLSKGFAVITPYVGAGYVFGVSDPDPSTGLEKVDVEDTKAYIGARISLGLFELTPEVGQIGDNVTYSLRTGFSF